MGSKQQMLILGLMILAILAAISVIFTANTNQPNTAYTDSESSRAYEPSFENIKSELQSAQKSGGISPESYEEIDTRIIFFESQGYDKKQTEELRDLLSKLSVGGQGGQRVLNENETAEYNISQQNNTVQQNESDVSSRSAGDKPKEIVTWDYNGKWVSAGIPPECPILVFDSPVDVTKATAILYPGQIRGESVVDYKPHGGFRFDNQNTNDIEVRVPFDGYVWRGSKFIDPESGNNIQYSFDIVNECGVLHRFGHLYELSPEFQEFAYRIPLKEGDSRTTELKPFVSVRKGDLMATKIGIPGNVGMDWGVYDLRKENEASKDPSYREIHKDIAWAAFHALCWLNYLPEEEQAIVKSLPGADGRSGKNSDYC